MNSRQIRAMWGGIAAAVAILLFPPWKFADREEAAVYRGHSLLAPPKEAIETQPFAVDVTRLLLLLGADGLVTGGLLVTFADRRKP